MKPATLAFPAATYLYMTFVPITPSTALIVKTILVSALAAHWLWQNRALREWEVAAMAPGSVRGLTIAVVSVVGAGFLHWAGMYFGFLGDTPISMGWLSVGLQFPGRAIFTMVRPNMNLVFPIIYIATGMLVAGYERQRALKQRPAQTPSAPRSQPVAVGRSRIPRPGNPR